MYKKEKHNYVIIIILVPISLLENLNAVVEGEITEPLHVFTYLNFFSPQQWNSDLNSVTCEVILFWYSPLFTSVLPLPLFLIYHSLCLHLSLEAISNDNA